MDMLFDIEHLKGKLEAYEEVYAMLTGNRILIIREDGLHYHFDDGCEARSLPDAVVHGRELVRSVYHRARRGTGA